MQMKDLAIVLEARGVQRYHTVQRYMPRTQTIADHSWGVAMIVHYIDPEASKDLILRALTHDVPEAFTGDISSITKEAFPEMRQALARAERTILQSDDFDPDRLFCPSLQPAEHQILRIADILECAYECAEYVVASNSRVARSICQRAVQAGELRVRSRDSQLSGQQRARALRIVDYVYSLVQDRVQLSAGNPMNHDYRGE